MIVVIIMDQHETNRSEQLAIITGGAHRLGRSIAIKLAQMGYTTIIHFNKSSSNAIETRNIIENQGGKAYIFQADLTKHEHVEQLFTEINELSGQLRVLINSAAVMVRGKLNDFDLDQWDLTMDLNLRAVWLCSMFAVKSMRNHGGNIINISDTGAGKLWSTYWAYSISKAGVDMLTRFMAKEFAPNIRVNSVAPGLIMPTEDFSRETWNKLVQRLPLKHPGSPEDVCSTIEFLIKNEYITGQVFVVDGGYQLV
jgi:pteridine reductase